MAESGIRSLILENRHTGERLALRRVKRGDEVWLELKGSLPPHSAGPPLHIHVAEDEKGQVRSGTLSAVCNGRRITAGAGECRSPAVRCIAGGTTQTSRLCLRAMHSLWWISTGICKPCSRS
jgi:hypothetical protein